MDRNGLKRVLVNAISKVKRTTYDVANIAEDDYLGGDLGVTSVEMLECMYDIQKELEIEIADTKLVDLYTVKDVIDLIINCEND